jgi:plasmid maintenance system antidote protein VapI
LTLWLALQARRDLEKLSKAKRAELAAIPTLVAAV